MLNAFPFPAWEPDKLTPGTLTEARNVLPIANGYGPVKAFSAVTTALSESFSGGGAFIDSSGLSSLLAATPTALKKYSGGAWGDLVTVATSDRWTLCQFGDNILCSNGGTVRSLNLVSEADSIPTSAPNAISIARIRDFVAAINTDNEVHWCQFNNSSDWTTGLNQSDTQPILGGAGVALVGGEYGILLRSNGVDRISYVGGDVVFQFDEISAEIGCMAQGSVANVGKLIFFWSERGPMVCDGAQVTPVGDEKIKEWFFARFSRQDMESMWAAIDPRNNVVMWAMPGTPGLLLIYNWLLQRFSYAELDIAGMFTGFTQYTSIDELDASYPSGIDSIPVSLDSSLFAGGNPLLLVVNADNEVGTLGGDTLEARLKLSSIEPTPGKRSRIRSLRPVTDANNASAQVNARMRQGDSEGIVSAGSTRTNGKLPIRCNGRYNDIALTIPAGEAWSQVQAVEVEFEAGDGR